jgi:hypothetical protein
MGSSRITNNSYRNYIEKFMARKSAIDLMPFFQPTGNPAKEITESYAMWETAKLLGLDSKDEVVCIVVGDGSTPRTAALVAFSSVWECHSIDPKINLLNWQETLSRHIAIGEPIRRLEIYPKYAKEVSIDCQGKRTLILLPHSHANMKDALDVAKNSSRIDIISMPCCEPIPSWAMEKKFTLKHNLKVFDDEAVWSPKRRIFIWEDMGNI